jgi:hypothetical protein
MGLFGNGKKLPNFSVFLPKSIPNKIMSNKNLIDDSFYIKQSQWGTWRSFDVNGKELITALNEENCISATRFYLKGVQEGWSNVDSVKYEGTVGGKL